MSYTQPLCEQCWDTEQPGRVPVKFRNDKELPCCMCGQPTSDGIYIRRDPKSCYFPYDDEAETQEFERAEDIIGRLLGGTKLNDEQPPPP